MLLQWYSCRTCSSRSSRWAGSTLSCSVTQQGPAPGWIVRLKYVRLSTVSVYRSKLPEDPYPPQNLLRFSAKTWFLSQDSSRLSGNPSRFRMDRSFSISLFDFAAACRNLQRAGCSLANKSPWTICWRRPASTEACSVRCSRISCPAPPHLDSGTPRSSDAGSSLDRLTLCLFISAAPFIKWMIILIAHKFKSYTKIS